jgi:hypothetical protein
MKRRRHSDLYIGLRLKKKRNMILLVHRVLGSAPLSYLALLAFYRFHRLTCRPLKTSRFKIRDRGKGNKQNVASSRLTYSAQ